MALMTLLLIAASSKVIIKVCLIGKYTNKPIICQGNFSEETYPGKPH